MLTKRLYARGLHDASAGFCRDLPGVIQLSIDFSIDSADEAWLAFVSVKKSRNFRSMSKRFPNKITDLLILTVSVANGAS